MLGVVRGEPVEQPWRRLHDGAGARMVRVECAERVGGEPVADVVGELGLALAQVPAQLPEILLPRLGGAEARQPHPEVRRAHLLEQLHEQQDQLRVERGIVGAERLGAKLRELPVAARLRFS